MLIMIMIMVMIMMMIIIGIKVKHHWEVEVVYTLPVTISATGVIAHTFRYVLKRLDLPDLLYVRMQRSVILNTCKIESS